MATRTVPQRTLPGPSALPLLGRWANMLKLFRDPCTYSRWLHDTYGDVVAMAHGDPAAELALQEMKVVLAMLLQRYRLAVVPNARIEPKGSNLDPAHGMPMRIIQEDRRFERVPVRGSIHRLVEFV